MKCDKCGKEIPEGSQFCNHCGRNQGIQPEETSKENVNKGEYTNQDVNTIATENVNYSLLYKKLHKKHLIVAGIATVLVITSIIAIPKITTEVQYSKATSLMDVGQYKEAMNIFVDIKDNKKKAVLSYCTDYLTSLCDTQDYDNAAIVVEILDSNQLFDDADQQNLSHYVGYTTAASLGKSGKYTDAYYQYIQLEDYGDSVERAADIFENHKEVFYELAIENYEKNTSYDMEYAKAQFEKLGDYQDSKDYLEMIAALENCSGTYYYGNRLDKGDACWVVDGTKITTYFQDGKYMESDCVLIKYQGGYCLADKVSKANIKYNQPAIAYICNSDGKYERCSVYLNEDNEIREVLGVLQSHHPAEDYQIASNQKEPTIGMTTIEVENSTWGKPEKINKATTASGVSEQWVYSTSRYVYLDDGIVTGIQE